MLYTELIKLWDESVQAVDAKDWQGALDKLEKITEPTSRTLFNSASANLALGQLEEALKVWVWTDSVIPVTIVTVRHHDDNFHDNWCIVQ